MLSGAGKVISVLRDYDSYNVTAESKRDTLIDLEFISRINVGQKINVRYRFLQNDGLITRFSRTFYNIDNKENTITFIDNTVSRAVDILKLYEADLSRANPESDDARHIVAKICGIIKGLEKAKRGITNLQKTYTGYDIVISRFERVISDIDTEIEPRKERYFKRAVEGIYESPMSPHNIQIPEQPPSPIAALPKQLDKSRSRIQREV